MRKNYTLEKWLHAINKPVQLKIKNDDKTTSEWC